MCHPDRDQFSRVTNEDLQKEIGDLRRDFQDQLDKQGRMLKLALRLKEVKDRGKQRRFSSPQ